MDSKWIPTFGLIVLSIFFQSQIAASYQTANLTTLRVTQVIYRHGSRSVDETYSLDPYINESNWYPGYSQLNNLGKWQGFNLGLYLRERYNGFVKDVYDVKDIYVLSSDLARTMQTAYSVLAGFYLPNDVSDRNITEDSLLTSHEEIPLPWKSVPVHTIPIEFDNIMRLLSTTCPRYHLLLDELKFGNVQPITEEEKQFYEYISNSTGANITNSIDYNLLMDSIHIEKYYNLTLPSWAEVALNSTLGKSSTYFTQLTKTFEMKRLRSGPLLERLVDNMLVNETVFKNEFYRSRDGQKKIYMFSGHDETITGVLNTLDIFDSKRPAFTAALMVELHQDINTQELYLEFYYRNETDKDPYYLKLPNCGEPCWLSDFRKLVEPYIPLSWSEECQLEEPWSLSGVWIAVIIVGVWVVLFMALQCWARIGRSRRNEANKQRDRKLYTHLK